MEKVKEKKKSDVSQVSVIEDRMIIDFIRTKKER